MINTNKLEAIVEEIEKNPNRIRIKKLLFCARNNFWKNDIAEIEKLKTQQLILDLYARISETEKLNSRLIEVVRRINKKTLYFSLANQTLNILKPIYTSNNSFLDSVHNYLKVNHQKIKYQNLFNLHFLVDLKFTVSRKTSLSQAKVLIYSALYYKFNYTVQDWNVLNQQEFDDLVRLFIHDCETLEEIEFRLKGAANYLDRTQNNIEVAHIIVKAIHRFYNHVRQQEGKNIISKESSEPPVKLSISNDRFDEDRTIEENPLTFNPLNFELDSSKKTQIERFSSTLPSNIEKDVKGISHKKVNSLMVQVEATLQELENHLEKKFPDSTSDEYFALKYRILRGFIHDIQRSSMKYLSILETLEQKDRKKRFPSGSLTQEP